MDGDENFANCSVLSDEATFHANGKDNRHNCGIWGTQNPRKIIQHERDSPKWRRRNVTARRGVANATHCIAMEDDMGRFQEVSSLSKLDEGTVQGNCSSRQHLRLGGIAWCIITPMESTPVE
ncbi:hypothetical protein ANN_16178 [Periplaneta americana]|uniref:Uncharacterized protein n=1 Tax=Periplaneta americana TaxID=6978 RepID=A0ABQ8SJC1_PERAM|nr:hypothetical protein ANN_16178 [Periplaneta americana]